MSTLMLTTTDNPFDPFDNFAAWYEFDVRHGYNSCNYLARVSLADDSMSEEMQQILNNQAIEEILKYNWLGIYTKVEK